MPLPAARVSPAKQARRPEQRHALLDLETRRRKVRREQEHHPDQRDRLRVYAHLASRGKKLIADHRWKVSDEAVAAIKASNLSTKDQEEILDQLSNVFEDDFPGNDDAETVAVFSLYNAKGNKPTTLKMLGEDYSFCARCRDSGIEIWLYVGNGSPVEHDGLVRFSGSITDVIRCASEQDQ